MLIGYLFAYFVVISIFDIGLDGGPEHTQFFSSPDIQRASSFCQSDSVLRPMWIVRLGLPMIFLKVNPLFIPCNYTIQKLLSIVLSCQNATCVFTLFHFSFVQLMWYPSTRLLSLSHLSWSIGNSLLTNAQFNSIKLKMKCYCYTQNLL